MHLQYAELVEVIWVFIVAGGQGRKVKTDKYKNKYKAFVASSEKLLLV